MSQWGNNKSIEIDGFIIQASPVVSSPPFQPIIVDSLIESVLINNISPATDGDAKARIKAVEYFNRFVGKPYRDWLALPDFNVGIPERGVGMSPAHGADYGLPQELTEEALTAAQRADGDKGDASWWRDYGPGYRLRRMWPAIVDSLKFGQTHTGRFKSGGYTNAYTITQHLAEHLPPERKADCRFCVEETSLRVVTREFTIDELAEAHDAGNVLQRVCHARAVRAGWWHCPVTGQASSPDYIRNTLIPQKLLLIHSEISEACEADRKGLNDSHLTHRNGVEVELADAAIRIFDLAGALGFDLGAAIAEKMEFNAARQDHTLAARAEANGKRY